ncbi:hypothetical protein COLO4_06522 [Corchorus olitorius]|uniref:Uncharacterized protein n=1 Tax=Corchorus olitorius TaxID=93759 RepID=A0A1R3KMV4_9ROSI|nr:hypothetical protein COLO4_06522 [Corchorus olitorius]
MAEGECLQDRGIQAAAVDQSYVSLEDGNQWEVGQIRIE